MKNSANCNEPSHLAVRLQMAEICTAYPNEHILTHKAQLANSLQMLLNAPRLILVYQSCKSDNEMTSA